MRKGDVLGIIAAPLVDEDCTVQAPFIGIPIAHTHLARSGSTAIFGDQPEVLQECLAPALPEDEVI